MVCLSFLFELGNGFLFLWPTFGRTLCWGCVFDNWVPVGIRGGSVYVSAFSSMCFGGLIVGKRETKWTGV